MSTTLSAPTSAASSTHPSPAAVQALHHPEQMAHVEVPQGVENIPQGMNQMGGKALLAKKMAASGSSFYSPTDTLVSPCTAKLHNAKGKRWANAKSKPLAFGSSSLQNSTTASQASGSAGFLHPNHAAVAAQQLQHQQNQQTQTEAARTDANGDTEMSS